ncbi:PQQ-binding-like beta-propeller repeat protein [Streptomyces griseus]|uniref:outer membrane protein assembly factor BamB family protein n=1 Tax=Streptomyces griseus TaxID=1911 RepID=UPI0004CBACA2|nr:PQQ-binding-like beta-propeller repeat protein [Streptomyces griseus]
MSAQAGDVPSGGRTGRHGRARRTLAGTAAALAVLGVLATGCSSAPEELGVVWDTPADPKAEEADRGAWLSGDTLVHSRFDAVRGFDARTGERNWEYVPPGRSAICSATVDTGNSVVVLARDGDGTPGSAKDNGCADVVAIDVEDGRELWHTVLPALDAWAGRLQSSTVSAGAGLAVLLRGDDLAAVDTRTGRTRWKAALPKGCVPGTTAVADRQVAALLACGGTEHLLGDKVASDAELFAAAFAPATGALLWSAPLGGRTTVPWDARAEFVSADPVVVAASSSGDSDSGAYFSFGATGRPHPPIDFTGPYGEIRREDRLTAAADDSRLYALPLHRVRNSRVDPIRLTAFDLATGEPVWGGTVDDDRLDGDTGYRVLPQDGRITVLSYHRETPLFGDAKSLYGLRILDAATGEQREARGFPEGDAPVDTLFPYEDRLIGARYESNGSRSKPFTAYERR